ncbi:MAG TPA: hypothetical protein VFV67_14190 [Actinophytocola sp.]|uniref:hypothetical protein n=1 Tax=Actinophytocola sp. TaxID=1872138 RepID=UPI002DBD0BBC|nr:hypothetical protein [Actinophytocola sp.]HEU5471796.1 hypothetical protein [Actinophytocola sp.]
MSRAPLKSTDRSRTPLAASLVGLVAALAVTGCGAGQDTQTDSVQPAVNGAHGNVGSIAIRNAQFAYPRGGEYPAGSSAPLVLTIVNTGTTEDELVEVSSAVAGNVRVGGDRALLPGRSIQVGTPDEEVDPNPTSSARATTTSVTVTSGPSAPSAPPSSPTAPPSSAVSASATDEPADIEIGKATIVLTGLSDPLRLGQTYQVTFVFRQAGTVTLAVPVASPITPRAEPSSEHG